MTQDHRDQRSMFWMSIVLMFLCLGTEIFTLVKGLPPGVPEVVVGRVLGLLDAVAMTVLSYWFGATRRSPPGRKP